MQYLKGQHLSLEDFSQTTSERHGICIEDEAPSPTQANPDRKVVRVRWDHDGSETIENTNDLY